MHTAKGSTTPPIQAIAITIRSFILVISQLKACMYVCIVCVCVFIILLQQKLRTETVFSFNDDFVFSCEEANVVTWDTRTGEKLKHLAGHSKVIRGLSASPTEPAFMSCSDDFR